MAIHSLNLNEGGGIITRNARSAPENTATVIIGIGGTGVSTLKTLKKKIYSQLEPSNPGEAIARYDMIRLLAIDTDDTAIDENQRSDSDLSTNEFKNLRTNNLSALLDPAVPTGRPALKNRPDLNNWMSINEIQPLLGEAGAGGIRQMGRFMLLDNVADVAGRIRQEINSSMAGLGAGGQVNIHIVAGISGGTGSGMFLDVCYIVRNVLSTMGVNGKLFGYFYLPDVVISKPQVARDAIKTHLNRRNGYAAFRELDYLMNLPQAQDYFEQTYKMGALPAIRTQAPPVDLCHLISATDSDGNIFRDGFQRSIDVVTDYIMAYLAKVNTAGVAAGADNGLTMQGHLANIVAGVSALTLQVGANNSYTVLGASNTEVPYSQFATYLACGFYEKLLKVSARSTVDSDVLKAAEAIGLSLDRIRGDVCAAAITPDALYNRLIDTISPRDLKHAAPAPESVHPAMLLQPCRSWEANRIGKIEQNITALIEDIDDYQRPVMGETNSYIARTHTVLLQKCLNASGNEGVFYAAQLLSRNGRNLMNVVQGIIAENLTALNNARNDVGLRLNELERTRNDFVNAMVDIGNNKFKAYLSAAVGYFNLEVNIDTMERIDAMLHVLLNQLNALYIGFYAKFSQFFSDLEESFLQNIAFLSDPVKIAAANGYTKRIVELKDVKTVLDAALQEVLPIQACQDFVNHLLQPANIDEWLSDSDFRKGRVVNEFMTEKFTEVLNQSIESFIRAKNPGATDPVIQQNIENQIIAVADTDAAPMFWKAPTYTISAGTAFASSRMTVPAVSALITAAAEHFAAASPNGYSVRKSGISDRIFNLRFYSGVPLFAYQGVTLMRQDYLADLNSNIAGLHLYEHCVKLDEKREKTPEDLEVINRTAWGSFLPSPIPFSVSPTHDNPTAIEADALDIFNRAKKAGIIAVSGGEWKILVSNNVGVEVPATKAEAYTENGEFNYGKLDTVIDETGKVLASWTDVASCKAYSIKNAASIIDPGYEDAVILDFFMKSPLLVDLARKAVTKYEALTAAVAALNKLADDQANKSSMFNDFLDVLVTGQIKKGIGKFSYTYSEFGFDTEGVLTQNSPDLDTNIFLFFKAYQGFCSMDEAHRADLIAAAADVKANLQDTPEDCAVANTYRMALKNTIQSIAARARTLPAARRAEVMTFYQDLQNGLENFAMQFSNFVPFARL